MLLVNFACLPSPLPRQVCWNSIRSYCPINGGPPTKHGGRAPALIVSRPAQRSLALRPACSPSHLSDPLHRRLRRFRFLHRRSDCFRVERTQFPGGTFTRSRPAPFHGAREIGILGQSSALIGYRSRPQIARTLRHNLATFISPPCNHRSADGSQSTQGENVPLVWTEVMLDFEV